MKNTVSNRLKQAREGRGKTPQEIAEAIGITVESYYDLESTDDLSMVLSLRKVLKLCQALALMPADLFGWQPVESSPLFPETLQRLINDYLNLKLMKMKSFEDLVGYYIAPFMANKDEFYEWNMDCLKAVCDAIGIDFKKMLIME